MNGFVIVNLGLALLNGIIFIKDNNGINLFAMTVSLVTAGICFHS